MNPQTLSLLLVDLALVLLLARAAGRLATKIGQPPVVGEIVAGILIGSTLRSIPNAAVVMPDEVVSLLSGLATAGVVWFLFLMGLELDLGGLWGRARSVASTAAWSTIPPFILGTGVATLLAARHPDQRPVALAVFIGLAMAVTALPVLARVLADRGLLSSRVGDTALAIATLDDLFVWTGLAVLLIVVAGTGSWAVVLTVPYVILMVVGLRPGLRRIVRQAATDRGRSHGHLVLLAFALLSGAATQAIGLHFIFGALFAGVVVSAQATDSFRAGLRERAETLSSTLMPTFFVIAGLNVNFSSLRVLDLAEGALILLVAVGGKMGGAYIGARRGGLPGSEARVLAVLLNTRGLTELIVLGAGYQAGLIDRALYSVLVCMAVITTAMTGPLLAVLRRHDARAARAHAALTPSKEHGPSPIVPEARR